jgi:hypothetical protein
MLSWLGGRYVDVHPMQVAMSVAHGVAPCWSSFMSCVQDTDIGMEFHLPPWHCVSNAQRPSHWILWVPKKIDSELLHKLKIVPSIPYFAMGVKPQYVLTELHAIAIGIFLFLDETQIQSLRCCSWSWEIQVTMIWQFMRKFTLLHGAERVSSQ